MTKDKHIPEIAIFGGERNKNHNKSSALANPVLPTPKRKNHADADPYVTGVFSVEEIKEANRRHDIVNGWSMTWPTVFTNSGRLPETFVGSQDDYWRMMQGR